MVEDEFFSEQSLSDELDQALDAPEEPLGPPGERRTSATRSRSRRASRRRGARRGSRGGRARSEEDVLEETPEFLQDTPEHDRLWFEQKPPKDFDFDD